MTPAVVLPIVISVVVIVVVLATVMKSGAFGPSKAKRELGQRLIATGDKGRATVMSIHPTGLVVNNVNVQCVLRFRIEPLRGGQPFDGEKTSLMSQVQMPRIGDIWPCWFDPMNRTLFTVGQPTEITPEQIAIFHEFGIRHPLDQQNPPPPSGPSQSSGPSQTPGPSQAPGPPPPPPGFQLPSR